MITENNDNIINNNTDERLMNKLFTSDLHIGDSNIHKYRPRFYSVKENDKYMLDMIQSLGKRDELNILGDFIFDCDNFEYYVDRLSTFECTIKLVLGNHDSKKFYQLPKETNIQLELPLYSLENMWVSHCPIHVDEFRGKVLNIHGHTHMRDIVDYRYFNVAIDYNGFEFVPFDKIIEAKQILMDIKV